MLRLRELASKSACRKSRTLASRFFLATRRFERWRTREQARRTWKHPTGFCRAKTGGVGEISPPADGHVAVALNDGKPQTALKPVKGWHVHQVDGDVALVSTGHVYYSVRPATFFPVLVSCGPSGSAAISGSCSRRRASSAPTPNSSLRFRRPTGWSWGCSTS